MVMSLVGLSVAELDTPTLLIDLDALEVNIASMAGTLQDRGVGWRPHAKAHKSPAVAHRLIAAGAHGITCAKLGEAEVYAASGIRDILVANQVVGPIKTGRLAYLALDADVIVAVDNIENVREIDAAAADAGSRPRVVIEVDSGMGRAGVSGVDSAVALAGDVSSLKNVRFAGVMAWEGHAVAIANAADREREIRAAVGRLIDAADTIRAAGIPVDIVSCGGTGTFLTASGIVGVTEVQAGGGIFGDAFYRRLDVPVQPALSLQVIVTSRPAPDRIVFDAGRKAIDPSNVPPEVVGIEGVCSVSLSAEHGTILLESGCDRPQVGELVRLNVGYSDQVVHLHEHLVVVREDRVVAVWPTLARGRLQ
ncbi:MAG: hypothetical protein AVDCRST_MAG43-1687 [uncultured Thermomicrobiales bacterium]|uniref:D-serine dehydratase-like domain-containing protein n=1 Tax=uncultured Thermomicrobiales bacterium TaxID=1645740 RepID=A0A6J4UV64_9BACT|nr:MAG: hypothetical protein AVDCRST_MAG43-1687 [uncultured Thermomicrobiales bacterium]